MEQKSKLLQEISRHVDERFYDLQSNKSKEIVFWVENWPTLEEAREIEKMVTEGKWSHWGVFTGAGGICVYLGLSCNCTHLPLSGSKMVYKFLENVKSCMFKCTSSKERATRTTG